jgi:ribosomal protein L7/L12
MTSATPLSPAAIAALHEGDKIEAIKLTRRERNCDLKTAKDAVDAYIESQPLLNQAFAEGEAQARRSALLWLAIIVGIAIAAYAFFAR